MYSFLLDDPTNKFKPVQLPTFKRGAVLASDKMPVQFAHPITTAMKMWEGVEFNGGPRGGSTVVDIRGNEPLLGNTRDDPMTDLGEMMVLMSDGRVEVSNEFDDAFWHRGFTLLEEREAVDKQLTGGDMGMGGMPGGMPGGGPGS